MTQQDEMIQALTQRACAAEARCAKLEASNKALAEHAGGLSLRIAGLEIELDNAARVNEADTRKCAELRARCAVNGHAWVDRIATRLGVDPTDGAALFTRIIAAINEREAALASLRERVRGLARSAESGQFARKMLALLDEPANEQTAESDDAEPSVYDAQGV